MTTETSVKKGNRGLLLDSKIFKSNFKKNLEFYKRVVNGLHTIPDNKDYVENTKAIANELIERTNALIEAYTALYENTKTTRTAAIKPRFCDRKLTNFFSLYYDTYLPDNGQYGIMDLNRIAPRAFSIYVKQKELSAGQFFRLNHELKELFDSPSIEDPSKSYLQLTQERIDELRIKNGEKQGSSKPDIIINNNHIEMNYSALKIIIPKFGIKYELTDPMDYEEELLLFAAKLDELNNQFTEMKKSSKK